MSASTSTKLNITIDDISFDACQYSIGGDMFIPINKNGKKCYFTIHANKSTVYIADGTRGNVMLIKPSDAVDALNEFNESIVNEVASRVNMNINYVNNKFYNIRLFAKYDTNDTNENKTNPRFSNAVSYNNVRYTVDKTQFNTILKNTQCDIVCHLLGVNIKGGKVNVNVRYVTTVIPDTLTTGSDYEFAKAIKNMLTFGNSNVASLLEDKNSIERSRYKSNYQKKSELYDFVTNIQ
jgi:hypothetical protein